MSTERVPGLAFARLVLRCLRVLPPGFAWWLGGVLGDAFARLPAREPRRARAHLAKAFPAADPLWVARTARESLRHAGRMTLWTLATMHRDPRSQRRGIAVEGVANLRATILACRRGEGTMGFTGHVGNWELQGRVTGTIIPVTVIAKRLRSPVADALVQESRCGGGGRVLYQDEDIRVLMREVRSGRFVASLIDQDIPRLAHVFVPWFGDLACTPVGPATLAIATGGWAQIGFLYAHSTNRGPRWVYHLSERVRFPRSRDRVADATAITAWMTRYQELLVRRIPNQWVWWHLRWRTRPAGSGIPSSDTIIGGLKPAVRAG